MNKGRLQFRHFESIFETREKAYKYIKDIVNESSGEGHRLDESLMAEPIVVVYKDAKQKPQAIVCIGVEGEKGGGILKPYHIIDSAKLEEEIQSMSADIKQEIEKEIESAISNVQSKLNAIQKGAGLKEDGTYHKHNTEGDMGNYISNATSIDNATVLLDSALKAESDRANIISGAVTDSTKKLSELSAATETFSSATIAEIARVDGRIDSSNTKLNELSAATETFSGATVTKFTEIDGKINGEINRATAAEKSISGTVNTFSAATKTAISNVQTELNAIQKGAGLKEDGTYHKHNTEGDMGNYISNATSIDNATVLLDSALKAESDRATAAEDAISSAVTDSTKKLSEFSAATKAFSSATIAEIARVDGRIDSSNTKLNELSAATETFSGATVTKFTEIDGKINDEITRATAAEKSISGDVDTLRDSIKTFSGATVDEIARLDAQSKKNKVKSTGNTIVVTEATEGTNLDVNIDGKTILSNKGELKTGLKVMPLAAGELEANVREAFRLVDNDGIPVDGTTIKIYKSSSLHSVELVEGDKADYVRITYIDDSGATQTMDLNIQHLIFESEFKDGLVVNENGEVRVKIDPASENFLSVSSEGVKVSGLQDAINTAVAEEKKRATDAEKSISGDVDTLKDSIKTFSGTTVTKFTEIDGKIDGEINRATAAEESISGTVNTFSAATKTAISNVQKELDATQTGAGLDTGGKYISHNNGNYIATATSIDNATVLLDSALKTESDRATAAEDAISSAVNTLSANTVSEVKRIENKISDNEKVISEAINQLKAEIDISLDSNFGTSMPTPLG